MKNYETELNPPQLEAVFTTEGPVLILAGAGSGKTRALTHRIAYLIEEKHVLPWHILAITFTNKAAEEMKSRVEAMTPQGRSVFVSTFHSACVRILRSGADRLGYTRDFTIYDTDDSRVLMRRLIKELDMDPKVYRERDVLARISAMKNELISAAAYAKASGGKYREEKISELYTAYQKKLLQANAMDFDDLLTNTVQLFRENPDILEQYRHRFRYILVDEYQDTNTAQFKILELLAQEHRNLCVVGDDDQSIYKFRGANIRNILDFEKAFPGAKVIRLEQNYRSTKNILAVANAVIAHNEGRKVKTLWTDQEDGEKVIFRQYPDAAEEARGILREIQAERARFSYGDVAILYRTNSQSRLLEEAFVRGGLPYRLIGGVNFYERKEVKDILAYLKVLVNPSDEVSLRRILNVPRRGIGDTSAAKIAELAGAEGISYFEALRQMAQDPSAKGLGGKLGSFCRLMDRFREMLQERTVAELIEAIKDESGYAEELLKENDATEAEARLENIRELQNKAEDYKTDPPDPQALNRFLEEVALVADVDALPEQEERVALMTLHSAKGLEFPKVYISGMEQEIFPGTRSLYSGDKSDLEEERRLAYVGFTRAKKKLVLTAARVRMINGRTEPHLVSQFVEEIPQNLLKVEGRGLMETRESASYRQERYEYEHGYGYGSRGDGYRSYGGRSGQRYDDDFGSDDGRKGRSGQRYGEGYDAADDWYDSDSRRNAFSSSKKEAPASAGWKDFGDSFGYSFPSSFSGGSRAGSTRQKAAEDPVKAYLGRMQEGSSAAQAEAALDPRELVPGDRVKQKRFGAGTVVMIEEGKRDLEVTVDFDNYGRKTLLAEFAKFEKI